MTRRAGKRWLWALALLLLFLAAAWFTECSPARFWARRGHLTDLISAMFPPDWGYTSRILTPLLATVQMSVTGTALGAFLALVIWCRGYQQTFRGIPVRAGGRSRAVIRWCARTL